MRRKTFALPEEAAPAPPAVDAHGSESNRGDRHPMKNRMNAFATPAALLMMEGNRFGRRGAAASELSGETTAVRKRSALPIEKHAYQPGTEPQRCVGLPTEIDRVRLIGELSRILHEPEVPESMKAAGLTLIGWLARRMPGEDAHALGVPSSTDLQRSAKKRR